MAEEPIVETDLSAEVTVIAGKKADQLTDSDREFITKNHDYFGPTELQKFGITRPEKKEVDGDNSGDDKKGDKLPKDKQPDDDKGAKKPKGAEGEPKDDGKEDEEVIPEVTEDKVLHRDSGKKKEEKSDEEDEDPELTAKLEKLMEKKYGEQFKEVKGQKILAEVGEFIANNPDAAKYKEGIVQYVTHKTGAYDSVPFEVIWHHLDYQNALKRGAKLERERLAKISSSGGGSGNGGNNQNGGGDSKVTASKIKAMSQNAFEAMVDKVRMGHKIEVDQD